MKYLCLVDLDEKIQKPVPDEECKTFGDELTNSRRCFAAEALQVNTATTVRVRNGKVSATDGPFIETKEHVAGFYLIDAKDANEAIHPASKTPWKST